MGIYKLITKRRSVRKFRQKSIKRNILVDCLNAARLAPSAANLQPLEFILITENLNKIFRHIKWGVYLKKGFPQKNEKPRAYILILSNAEINKDAKYDTGLAAENIVLTAFNKGVSSCIVNPIKKNELMKTLKIPKNYSIELGIALGYPKHKSFEEKFVGDIRYWLDLEGNLHVPKRRLKNIVHEEKF